MMLATLTLLAATSPLPVQDDAFGIEVFEYLDRLHQDGFAGTVLVVKGDERLFAEGFGFANREEETPWTTETHSTVGSISKQFTAAAILKLAEQKKLSVEDPLGKFFEQAPEDKRAITLHQLLTHSSGISEYGRLKDTEWVGRDEFVSTVLEKPLQFEPGQRYEYSNAGFSILAAIVEQVSGKGYEAFLVEELFKPAGLKETGFLLPEYDRERLAVGYRQEERWGIMLDDMYFEDGPSWLLRGNGGVYSTAEEMHRWVRALAAGTVLSEKSVEQLWTPYVDETNGAGQYHYGYGWSIYETRGGDKVVWHNGNDAGPSFFNDMAWVPEQQVFVMLQTNTYEGTVEDIVSRILERLLSETPLPH
jgi:CubicO group peptidase (beta-lactamase class C family)